MGSEMTTRLKVIVALVLIGLMTCVSALAKHYYTRAITAESSIESSVMVTKNVLTTMNLINKISEAAHEEKQSLAEKGETHVVYIHQALKGDACANQPVPVAASDSLQQLKDNLRTGTSSTNQR